MPLVIKKPPQTEEETAKRSKRDLLLDGTYLAHISAAWNTEAKKTGRPLIAATVLVRPAENDEREITLYLNTSDAGLLLLRHTCLAVNALAAFEAGEIEASLFPGHDLRVVIGTEKKGKWPARNVILDVLPASSAGVVPLRAAE
jgi:hypothetical protein